MKITLGIDIDLGEQGTDEEQLRDADTIVHAIHEALAWHGQLLRCTGWSIEPNGQPWAWSTFHELDSGMASTIRHHGKQVELAGVSWGGK